MSETTQNAAEGQDELIFTAENGIGILTLNRPHRRNALTFAMYDKSKYAARRARQRIRTSYGY